MNSAEATWTPDILGPDFQAQSLNLGPDPDGESDVLATLVRYQPDDAAPADNSRPAVLWVHGMTDYFFHRHVAEHFYNNGYDFYAVDLRKCGRSRQGDQTWHYVSDVEFYFDDLDAATAAIPNDQIVPIAHSTGGLIVPLWLDYLRRTNAPANKRVPTAILNSPWLDMMSIPEPVMKAANPILKWAGKILPGIRFPGGNLTAFGESIHSTEHGEWDYDLKLKPMGGHPKYLGWLRAILIGFDTVHTGKINVGRPLLTLCSAHSHLGKPYSPESDTADTVIDVHQTQRQAPKLGDDITICPILGGRHDLFLSLKPARDEAFRLADQWLSEHTPAQ